MTDWLHHIQIEHPIIQAGMAGGITTPELVANVAKSGALGTIGAGYMPADTLRQEIRAVKERTKRPFAVNLFAADLTASSADISDMQAVLQTFRDVLGLAKGAEMVQVHDYLSEKIDVILEESIPVVSTAFGVLPQWDIKQLKRNDVTLIGMATNLDEAEQLVKAGYDIVVAQGSEAGGHRGTFDLEKYPNGCNIGLLTLVQDLLDNLTVPVIAAGGITGKRQADALLAMGAAGVQVGTRFLTAKEAGTNQAYRQSLFQASGEETVLTKVFSGRPARAIHNTFIRMMDQHADKLKPFPIQNQLTKDIRAAAKREMNSAYQSLWAGQGAGQIVKEETAAEIVRSFLGK